MNSHDIDPVSLTAELIRCPSVTPREAGALVFLEKLLSREGFVCTRADRGQVSNLSGSCDFGWDIGCPFH